MEEETEEKSEFSVIETIVIPIVIPIIIFVFCIILVSIMSFLAFTFKADGEGGEMNLSQTNGGNIPPYDPVSPEGCLSFIPKDADIEYNKTTNQIKGFLSGGVYYDKHPGGEFCPSRTGPRMAVERSSIYGNSMDGNASVESPFDD